MRRRTTVPVLLLLAAALSGASAAASIRTRGSFPATCCEKTYQKTGQSRQQDLFGVRTPHTIHALQNQHSPQLAAGVSIPAASVFQIRPDSLLLAPDVPSADSLKARHAALRAHVVYEEILPLAGLVPRFDVDTALNLLRSAPTLAGIEFRDDSISFQKVLFRGVDILGTPRVSGDAVAFTVRVDDCDFGSVRFDSGAKSIGSDFSFEMVNSDSIRFLFFPAVRPGRALVDILYFVKDGEPYVYVAWSVRATLFFSAVAPPIERNLRARASVLKDWFVSRVGGNAK